MISNLIVALSNFPCIYPISRSILQKDYLTTSIISFVASASFFSHLVENHKHGMPGIGFSKKISYFLNRIDVLGCLLVSLRFSQLYYLKYGLSVDVILKNKLSFMMLCLPFIFLRISEYDKYNPKLKNIYIITHSIWHMTIFRTMEIFLSKYLY